MVACAPPFVAASVFGTMAYLTSTDTVTNTFTVGPVAIKLTKLMKLTALYERTTTAVWMPTIS